jgi:predicted secreted protein
MNNCVLICHCLLDPLTRVKGARKMKRDIVAVLINENIGMIQLPCPEIKYGFSRPQRNKEDYDTPEYRKYCRRLADEIAETVKEYENAGYTVFGLISIGGSPTCGFQRTHVKGEPVKEPGVFIEELQEVFKAQNLKIEICDHDVLEKKSEKRRFLSLCKN